MQNSEVGVRECRWRIATVGLPFVVAGALAAGIVRGDDKTAALPSTTADAAGAIDFRRDVAPIFARSCVSCHGPTRQKSGFRIDDRQRAISGGELGPAIVPGQPDQSPLLTYVDGSGDLRMPPIGPKLTAAEVATLRLWIERGAPWPQGFAVTAAEPKSEAAWWSFRPLRRPEIPTVDPADAPMVRNPIDAFILAKLREQHLKPSPMADPATLVRRLSFDLHGLPPDVVEVDHWLRRIADSKAAAATSSTSPAAAPIPAASTDGSGIVAAVRRIGNSPISDEQWNELVDRFLDSPRYGERWARHWLDVVHYGESHGYDKDKPRPNAWPYRDYVIGSLNADKPYSRFAAEQIAGDALYPGEAEGIMALGFIAAGPWDFIGHAELPESKIDGAIARHLDRDDMAANAISSFLSLTVHCAACHDHKFDPITQDEYYGLQSVFAALDRTDRPFYRSADVARKALDLESRRRSLLARRTAADAAAARTLGEDLVEMDRRIRQAEKDAAHRPQPQFGYHSAIASRQDLEKWVQVDLGRPVPLERIEAVGCHDDFNNIGAGFGFPLRFRIEASDDPTFATGVSPIADHTQSDFANPGVRPLIFPANGVTARYVRFTATRLCPRDNDFNFALAELSVFDKQNQNVAFGQPVTALDSIDFNPRWRRENLVDGYYFGKVDPALAAAAEEARRQRRELFVRRLEPSLLAELDNAAAELLEVDRQIARLPKPDRVYAGGIHEGSPPFAGTAASGGKPRPIHVLERGDVRKPLRPAIPGALACVGLPHQFPLPPEHSESDRRVALARWITHRDNPLFWRSIANRVWQYHFGRGLVDTPNDFGRMGDPPSHPELLDWLAFELRENGHSLKRLHRLICNSYVYRQSSASIEEHARIDAGNRFLWRANRRRLEAEAVRDAMLFVAGKLDLTMGGPSFQDFVVEKPEHSPHYQYHLHNPEDPATHRRSIYRFLVRSKPQPFMAALDCADPSLSVEKRNESISPQQALAMLNGPLSIAMARRFSERLAALSPNADSRVDIAFALALARLPEEAERRKVADFARRHGWENACRLLFNLNEFSYSD